jgi:putative membrane protein
METTSAKTLRSRVLVFIKGMAMGVADSVPGVSGGTIAVMVGIYEELINSLKNLNPLALWEYKKRGLAGFWQSINGSFLLTLLLGIVTALYLSANTVLYLLETHYPQLMAFFCGLVLASTFFLRRQVLRWGLKEALFLLLGIVLTLLIAFINPLAGQTGYVYLFLCGAIAICAMILPGISGAFILLLLGVYDYVLAALRALDVGIIVVFAAGCATGLLSFSHLLSWTFRYYREQTYAFLTGMLLASIVVLWPWKIMPDHGAVGASYLSPSAYAATTGSQVSVLCVAALFILGFALVTIFERISRSRA